MYKETAISDLIEEWQILRNDGWKLVGSVDKIIEKHMEIEESISTSPIHCKEDAFKQLEFLYNLWWDSIEKPVEGRDYVWLNVFANVLSFLRNTNLK